MESTPKQHFGKTAKLAFLLKRPRIYEWLVTKGYFPESYVLPPCFSITKHPCYGKVYCAHTKKTYKPKITEYQQVHFPKTDFTDRTFGFIDPELHSDIAYIIAKNWKVIIGAIFHKDNKVCTYSFPIPLDSNKPGTIGGLRSGRMIYEFIEMAENDIASIAFNYNKLSRYRDKNFTLPNLLYLFYTSSLWNMLVA